MKSIPTAVQALLAGRVYWSARCYRISLPGGAGTLNYTDADCDVEDPATGTVYQCGGMSGPFVSLSGSSSGLHQKLGTGVDQLVIDIAPGSVTISGFGFAEAARIGLLSGAQVTVRQAVAAVTGAGWPLVAAGTFVLFTGFVADIDGGGALMSLVVNSPLERLQSQWPRNIVAATCCNVLGDIQCGVSTSSLAVSGSAAAGSTASAILSALNQAVQTFDLGTLTFTSGALAGISRSVRVWTPGSAVMTVPFPEAPATGDGFTISPGCDLTTGPNGCARFSNLANFRGFPFVPAPTTAGA